VDFGDLNRNLEHIWRRPSSVGRCQEVRIWQETSRAPGRHQDFAPLHGSAPSWSTLGVTPDPLRKC
jgi:hypothetical protein